MTHVCKDSHEFQTSLSYTCSKTLCQTFPPTPQQPCVGPQQCPLDLEVHIVDTVGKACRLNPSELTRTCQSQLSHCLSHKPGSGALPFLPAQKKRIFTQPKSTFRYLPCGSSSHELCGKCRVLIGCCKQLFIAGTPVARSDGGTFHLEINFIYWFLFFIIFLGASSYFISV